VRLICSQLYQNIASKINYLFKGILSFKVYFKSLDHEL
jgi:hypothetical protein